MKTIESIKTMNLKGRAAAVELAPLTAILGPNAGGKTAIANAIMIALLGHVPALGKLPKSTVQLMTAGEPFLDILATGETGEKINRRFDVKTNGRGQTIKVIATGPDFSETVNPCQLDFDQFRAAKPTERQRILESLMASTADEAIVEEACNMMASAGVSLSTVLSGEAWLQRLEADAKEQAKFLKQESDTAAKTILQLSGEERPAGISAEAIAETREKLAAAREAKGKAAAHYDAIAEAQQNAPEKPDGEPTGLDEIEAAIAKLDEMKSQHSEKSAAAFRRRAAEQTAREILAPHAGIEPLQSESEPMTGPAIVEELRIVDAKTAEVQKRLTTLATNQSAKVEQIMKLKTELAALASSDCCPTCGVSGDTFHESARLLFSEKIGILQKEVAELEADQHLIEGQIDGLEKRKEEIRDQERIRNAHASYLAHQRAAALLDAEPETGEYDRVKADLAEQQQKNIIAMLNRDAALWDAWNNAKIPTAEQAATAREEFEKASFEVERLAELESQHAKQAACLAAWNSNQASLAVLERENEKRALDITALATLAGWAKDKSREVTVAAMKPLLEVCNLILDGITEGQIAIVETSIGVERNGDFLPLEVLSGSEAVALSAAIQIAIASKSEMRLVMIDELSRLTVRRKTRLIDNINQAIKSGMVDQVIVFDHDTMLESAIMTNGGKTVFIGIDK